MVQRGFLIFAICLLYIGFRLAFHIPRIRKLAGALQMTHVEPASASTSAPASASSAKYKPRILFVLGGPGAGKGTQSEKLAKEFGIMHLSAGDLLRAERNKKNSVHGALIDTCMSEGKIVPVAISLQLLRNAIEESRCNRYLIDGFPRNAENYEGWRELMEDVAVVEKVLFIECGEAELQRRLLLRGLTSGRNDDNPASIKKRFTTFQESSMPVVRLFDGLGLVLKIDGTGTVDEVFSSIRCHVFELLATELLAIARERHTGGVESEGQSESQSTSTSEYGASSFDVNVTSGRSAIVTYMLGSAQIREHYELSPNGWRVVPGLDLGVRC